MSAAKFIAVLVIGLAASNLLCLLWLNIAYAIDIGAWDRGWGSGAISGTVSTLALAYIWSRLTP